MLTGVNKNMWDSTADELTKLNVKRKLIIGENAQTFCLLSKPKSWISQHKLLITNYKRM